MNSFQDQLKTRKDKDTNLFENAFYALSAAVMGHSKQDQVSAEDKMSGTSAIEEILHYMQAKIIEPPQTIEEFEEKMEYMLRPTGIMYRHIELKGKWYKNVFGAMIATKKDKTMVALLPNGFSGCYYHDAETGKKIKISKKNYSTFETDAFCFYKPFPPRTLVMKDLLLFILKSISLCDYMMVAMITLVITAIGLIMPYSTRVLFSSIIPAERVTGLFSLAALMLGTVVASSLYRVSKLIMNVRIGQKLTIVVKGAAMARLLSLPPTFFRQYSAGEMANRLNSIENLCTMLREAVLESGLTALFSLLYLVQIFNYSGPLAVTSLVLLSANLIWSFSNSIFQFKLRRKTLNQEAKLEGLIFSIFSGVQKIKLSGSEKRIFAKWANQYKENVKLAYDPPFVLKISPVVNIAFQLGGLFVLYYVAAISGVSAATFIAFNMAYGMVNNAVMGVANLTDTIANIKPVMEMISPIMKTPPEVQENKKIVTKLSGSIELNNVSFRYTENGPNVLEGLTLKINPNQYVAIVGKTGCGKSTLMRLLLGFEQPQTGAIYYDGKDLSTLDVKSVRQKIGVVMQNSKLFSGDIYSNILITAPWLSIEDAWEAARMAGIAEDIENMPMGMYTMLSEGSGGISGGQRQRLMIARAIASKPKIIMFDEATSALDNISQKQVSESLDKLKSTRVVIAHRLSTIKNCDRIIFLEQGKVIEDGTYEQLLKQGGAFAELVKRQRI